MIKNYLQNNVLIFDGAMGTYYSELTGNDVSYCEFANLNDKDTIKKIHNEYIKAGAKLIRTNTFSANTYDLGVSLDELSEIIKSAVEIAKEVVNTSVYIGASIGPIKADNLDESRDEILSEYKYIVDCFLEEGIDIFIFETFSNYIYLEDICKYIKSKNNNSFILAQFAVKPDGFTRDGLSVNKLIKAVKAIKKIDAYGFNCGSGPTHISEIIRKINIGNDIVSALPNAGFPELIHERTVYPNNPKYFAKKVNELKSSGVSIIGGCCGTNPNYIKEITSLIEENTKVFNSSRINNTESNNGNEIKVENTFKTKLDNDEFVVAIELSAPVDTNISKLIEGAKICKENNIDLVTVPDSPMSKVKADSAIIAAKIKREVGIEAMPHICCRDKNTNAIRSTLIGSHIEDIRNILAITGDPVSDASKVETKSVFNLNSFRLIELIEDMNEEVFKEDNILIGGALNLNVLNKEVEFNRMLKKIEKGAKFFLTQPIYDDDAIEFLKRVKERTNVKILAGLLPVVSYRNAIFLNNELPGVTIPDKYVKMFSENMNKEEAQEVGISITVEIANKLKSVSDGLYFITPFNRVNMLIEIIKQIKG